MIAADTSVVVAAFASWHESHIPARRALDAGLRLVDHCALESYSVLTRLPAPHRSPASIVREFLETRFPQPLLRLTARDYRQFVLGLAGHDIADGSAYDALVACTAVICGAELATCDRRAIAVYERYNVRTRFVS